MFLHIRDHVQTFAILKMLMFCLEIPVLLPQTQLETLPGFYSTYSLLVPRRRQQNVPTVPKVTRFVVLSGLKQWSHTIVTPSPPNEEVSTVTYM